MSPSRWTLLACLAAACATDVGDGGGPTAAVDGGPREPGDDAPTPDAGGGDVDADPCGWIRVVDLGGERLNVRAEPAVDADVVGSVGEGGVVEVVGERTGDRVTDAALGRDSDLWYEVPSGGGTGYVTSIYVECTTAPAAGGCGETAPTTWVWPTPTTTNIVQGFGNPIEYQTCGFHTGLDVAAAEDSPIVAAADGEVVHVGPMWYSGAGQGRGPYAVIVRHGPDLYSTYGHNNRALVAVGDCVAAGDPLADMGSLGYSSGPHLHLEIVRGTPFTGDWQTPFADVCAHYVDPATYVSP